MEDLTLISPGEIRVRLAPAPTGPWHIGNSRTALFNYLFSKKYQGTFILRIDDTDVARSKKKWEEEIIEGLKWLGIDWQEGPFLGGKYGPYRQSERKEIYKKYIQKLLDEKELYYCFCSEEELQAQRQYLMSIGKPPRYSGKCRGLSQETVKKNIREQKSYVLRFKTSSKKIVFEDMLRGRIDYDTDSFGDIVAAKSTTEPLYNLASVIDDFEMKITHIIRGEDHIPNTPKQILMAEALGIKPPKYLHLPLILGPDRAKLSSRHGAKSVLDYKEEGYLPEAMVNFLSLLGWNPGTDKEIFSMRTLVREFSVDGLQKAGAVFNPKKLDWLNGFYIRQKPLSKLTELCVPYLIKEKLILPHWGQKEVIPLVYSTPFTVIDYEIPQTKEKVNFDELKKIISLYQERLKKLSEIPELTDFFFKKQLDFPKELLRWKEMSEKEIKDSLDKSKKVLSKIKEDNWIKENIEKILMEEANKVGDRGKLLWPLRVALAGKKGSAGPFEISEVLGKEKTLQRLKEAGKKL